MCIILCRGEERGERDGTRVERRGGEGRGKGRVRGRGGKPKYEIARGTYFVVILEGRASRDFVGSFQAEIDRHHWLAAEVVGMELHRHTHTYAYTH